MMPAAPRYYSTASRSPRLGPDDLPFSIGVTPAPGDPMPVGIAYPIAPIRDDRGRAEAAWRLVVGGVEVEGRFALRGGAFVELAEDA